MKRLTLTAEQLAQLGGLTESVEVRNEAGKVLGFLDPVPPDVPGGWGPFTAEQIARARKGEGPTCTLDDIGRQAGLL